MTYSNTALPPQLQTLIPTLSFEQALPFTTVMQGLMTQKASPAELWRYFEQDRTAPTPMVSASQRRYRYCRFLTTLTINVIMTQNQNQL